MIQFYFNRGPNPAKVALFLEEAGLPYDAIPVDTTKGEQFTPEFTAINPNNKLPAIVDDGVTVFDSNAILLYLAEKYDRFLPDKTPVLRGELLSWLMFVATGVGPYAGQAAHFRNFAPEPKDYPVQRYTYEARRHFGILDARLAGREWIVGERYTIVDMAVWGWAQNLAFVAGPEAVNELTNLKRYMATIDARPAVSRAMALRDRFEFKEARDDEFRRNMFRHTKTS